MSDPSNKAKAIFLEAIEKYAPEQWPAFVDEACANDPPLRSRVEQLLRARSELGSFHEASQSTLQATIDHPNREAPGTMIGPYKLLQQIGEGGMGTVYMAEQTQPVRRKVALKILKPGMDTRQVVARFEAERQALAIMDHPNIARVFDGGATENGLPYFVMELVHGVPITKYCDDNHLTPRERLELFVPVCHAIQHAHQKGIIHRDIKPSNVMVTLYDGKPVPKVIDFGVAKATEQNLTERTLFTQYGTMVGTLEYMSPEQAEMSALGVDTRSDIYSLGVLLYELLTGSTPLTNERMKEAAYAEILRMIKEEEPPKPSTRLSDSKDTLPSISAQRQMDPTRLTKLVRGELDWIVMKALEKDRNRRYETASALGADVQRYLSEEPVQACPPSAGYRLRKFARRNRIAMTTTAVLTATLLVAGSAAAWGGWKYTVDLRAAKEASEKNRREADRQRQVAIDNLRAVIADIQDLENRRPELDDLRQDLLVRMQRYLSVILTDPAHGVEADEAEFWLEIHIGDVCRDLEHRISAARTHYQRAGEIAERVTSDGDSELVRRRLQSYALSRLGDIHILEGDFVQGVANYQKMLALRVEVHAAKADRLARADLAVAHLKVGDGYFRQLNNPVTARDSLIMADKHFSRCHELYEALTKEFPDVIEYARMYGHAWDRLADLRRERAEWESAIAACQKALNVRENARLQFPDCELAFAIDRTYTQDRLGLIYCQTKQFDLARQTAEDSLRTRTVLVQRNPRSTWFKRGLATSYQWLADSLVGLGRTAEARTNYEKGYAIMKALSDAAPESGEFHSHMTTIRERLNKTKGLLDRPGEEESRPDRRSPAEPKPAKSPPAKKP